MSDTKNRSSRVAFMLTTREKSGAAEAAEAVGLKPNTLVRVLLECWSDYVREGGEALSVRFLRVDGSAAPVVVAEVSQEKKTETLSARVTPEERAEYNRLAGDLMQPMGSWARVLLLLYVSQARAGDVALVFPPRLAMVEAHITERLVDSHPRARVVREGGEGFGSEVEGLARRIENLPPHLRANILGLLDGLEAQGK